MKRRVFKLLGISFFLVLFVSLTFSAVGVNAQGQNEKKQLLITTIEDFRESIKEKMKMLEEKQDAEWDNVEKCHDECDKEYQKKEEGIVGSAIQYAHCTSECWWYYNLLDKRYYQLANIEFLLDDILRPLRFEEYQLKDEDKRQRTEIPTAFTKEVSTTGDVFVIGEAKVGKVAFQAGEERIRQGDDIIVLPNSSFEAEVEGMSITANGESYGGHIKIPEKEDADLKVNLGKFRIKVKKIPKGKNEFKIYIPVAAIAVRGTEFAAEVTIDGATRLAVLDGVVDLFDSEGKETIGVSVGNQVTIGLTDELPKPEPIDQSNIERWWEETEKETEPEKPVEKLPKKLLRMACSSKIGAVTALAVMVFIIGLTSILIKRQRRTETENDPSKILKILGIGLFVFLTGTILVFGVRFYFEKKVKREAEQLPLTPAVSPVSTAEISFNVEELMSLLRETLIREDWLKINDYSQVSLEQVKGKYEGFDWLNEKNEIELIKGAQIVYDPEDFPIGDTPPDPNIINGVKKINAYLLEKGFTLNERNKWFQSPATEREFWETGNRGRIAYEKGNIKCYLGTETNFTEGGFSVGCGDISKSETPPEYRAIYYEANPEKDLVCWVTIENVVNNFAIGGSGCPFGAAKIWKEENGEWQLLSGTQAYWSCSMLLDNKVPPFLFISPQKEECIFYECDLCEGDECKAYEKRCEKDELGMHPVPFVYEELYKEEFGEER
jgi:hypothetical protein